MGSLCITEIFCETLKSTPLFLHYYVEKVKTQAFLVSLTSLCKNSNLTRFDTDYDNVTKSSFNLKRK